MNAYDVWGNQKKIPGNSKIMHGDHGMLNLIKRLQEYKSDDSQLFIRNGNTYRNTKENESFEQEFYTCASYVTPECIGMVDGLWGHSAINFKIAADRNKPSMAVRIRCTVSCKPLNFEKTIFEDTDFDMENIEKVLDDYVKAGMAEDIKTACVKTRNDQANTMLNANELQGEIVSILNSCEFDHSVVNRKYSYCTEQEFQRIELSQNHHEFVTLKVYPDDRVCIFIYQYKAEVLHSVAEAMTGRVNDGQFSMETKNVDEAVEFMRNLFGAVHDMYAKLKAMKTAVEHA